MKIRGNEPMKNHTTMKVIAQRGKVQYLLAESIGSEMGQVMDIIQGKLFREMPIAVIAKGGYWKEAEMEQAELEKLLAVIEEVAE